MMNAATTFSSPVVSPAVPADDLLSGARAIAAFLGWTRRRLYYEADADRQRLTRFPLFRVGATLTARKSSLLRWLAEQEAAALQSRLADGF